MLAHELDDESADAQVSEFIAVLYIEQDDALEGRLVYLEDLPALQMFSQQHAEIRGCERSLLIKGCNIDERERSRSAEKDPVGDLVALYREDQFILL